MDDSLMLSSFVSHDPIKTTAEKKSFLVKKYLK